MTSFKIEWNCHYNNGIGPGWSIAEDGHYYVELKPFIRAICLWLYRRKMGRK